jgi:hypothetical protein
MKDRIKKMTRIARLMEHQKEAMEMEVLQTRNRLATEETRLQGLRQDLQGTLSTFEKRIQDREEIFLQDVVFLYGMHHSLSRRIEKKRQDVGLITREMEVQEGLLLEAYQKTKVFGLFQDKMIHQDEKETNLAEQKSLDFLNLKNGNRK